MKKLLTIAKDATIKVNSQVTDYLLPSFCFLPINEKAKMLISNKKIKKGEPVFSLNKKTYYSPISGNIIKIISQKNYLNEDQLYLKIKNDFQENDHYIGTTEFTTVTIRTDFPKKIKEYKNYEWSKFQNKKELILNGIEDEPYLASKIFLHKLKTSELLQMLDLLSSTFQIKEISIYLKENDRESIEAFEKQNGIYPNIHLKILPDVYPIGEKHVFQNYLKLGTETLVVTTEELFDMYYNIVKERQKDSILVTITGDAIKNPQVVNVKIGTPLKDVVKDCIQLQEKEYVVLLNGLMRGKEVQLDKVILTGEVRGVYFMKKKESIPKKCMGCGKCLEVCPMKCNPYRSYLTNGKYQNPNCLKCGLCTFICPSEILLTNYLGSDKNE